MEQEGLQEEEREVLQSIYEGDDCFKQLDRSTFQYKVSETGSPPWILTRRAFLVRRQRPGEDAPAGAEMGPQVPRGAPRGEPGRVLQQAPVSRPPVNSTPESMGVLGWRG